MRHPCSAVFCLAVACLFRQSDNVTRWVAMVTRHIPQATPVLITESHHHAQQLQIAHPGLTVVTAQFEPCGGPAWPLCPLTRGGHNSGYRNMCRLWYADMWPLFDGFDAVVRVDSDITIVKAGAVTAETIASPHIRGADASYVTEGMHTLFGAAARCTKNPYTNVMVANLTWIRTSATLHMWFDIVKATNCICHNRWGDLPLWGETRRAMSLDVTELPGWRYKHGSHHDILIVPKNNSGLKPPG